MLIENSNIANAVVPQFQHPLSFKKTLNKYNALDSNLISNFFIIEYKKNSSKKSAITTIN